MQFSPRKTFYQKQFDIYSAAKAFTRTCF